MYKNVKMNFCVLITSYKDDHLLVKINVDTYTFLFTSRWCWDCIIPFNSILKNM